VQIVSALDAQALGAEVDAEDEAGMYLAPFCATSSCIVYPAASMLACDAVDESDLETPRFQVQVLL
jgi:hypothetical protein